MATASLSQGYGDAVRLVTGSGPARALVVCEHASNRIPEVLGDLGLDQAARESHIAWDPGALGVATVLAARISAPLVHGTISRLVYDCNRPPDAASAIPEASEVFEIPGNRGLTGAGRQERIDSVYTPFHRMLGQLAGLEGLKLLVTIHSFTPVFHGRPRDVEIGLLHGDDDRFARAMLAQAPADFPHDTRLNEPYGPGDGVFHTIDRHGAPNGLLSVMVEIRSDLIADARAENAMGTRLADWIEATLAEVGA